MPPVSEHQSLSSNVPSIFKLTLVALASLIVGASAGAYGYSLYQKIYFIVPVVENNASDNPYFPYQIFNTPVYVNKALGFSITVPSSWKRYAVREDNDGINVVITLGLPLERATSTPVGYPENSSHVINIEHFKITKSFAWKSEIGRCADVDGPCEESDVMASSSQYVFSTFYPKPHAGWNFSEYFTNNEPEPYVVAVWKDFDLKSSLKVFEPLIR